MKKRVAFIANDYLDPKNPRAWSGLPWFISNALESSGIELKYIPVVETHKAEGWAKFAYWRIFHRKRYLRYCNPNLLKSYSAQIERALTKMDEPVDAIFSLSTWPLAFLNSLLPSLFWTDACFAGVLGFYDSFNRIAPPSIRDGHMVEQKALSGCAAALYSSRWAADTAQQFYRVDSQKVHVVPFGGNLKEPPSADETSEAIKGRDFKECRLLLVGVDWERKGVDIAVEAVESLVARGFPARLTIVGCNAPAGRKLPPCVEVIPFISKATLEGRARLNDLFKRSHFFIMPSRAEAFGLVFAEASAFGLPSLASDVGGISSAVTNGTNGRLFPKEARGAEYAEFILKLMHNPEQYTALAFASLDEFHNRLTWNVAAKSVGEILNDVCVAGRMVRRPAEIKVGR